MGSLPRAGRRGARTPRRPLAPGKAARQVPPPEREGAGGGCLPVHQDPHSGAGRKRSRRARPTRPLELAEGAGGARRFSLLLPPNQDATYSCFHAPDGRRGPRGETSPEKEGKGGLGGKGEGKPGLCGSRTDKLTVWGLRFHPRLPRAGRWGARTPRRPQAPIPIPKFSKKLPPFSWGT